MNEGYIPAHIPKEKLFYLASPYSKYPAGKDVAWEAVTKNVAWLLERGYNVVSPIAHSHLVDAVKEHKLEPTEAFWLTYDFKWIEAMGGMIVCMMDNWQNSSGVQKEIKFCREKSIPVYYITPKYGARKV